METPRPNRPQWWRVVLLVVLIGAIWLVGWATGVHEWVTVDELRAQVAAAGSFGVALFIGLFCIGQLAQITGHPFIAASVIAWGWWEGAIVSIVAATIGAIVSFAFSRAVGGDVSGSERPFMRRILSRLDATPLRTIFVARLIFMTAPPLATALAVSGVRHRDHAVATFLGLIPSVFVTSYAWGVGLDWFEVIK